MPCRALVSQAELRGLTVLPPHGAWVTEASIVRAFGFPRLFSLSLSSISRHQRVPGRVAVLAEVREHIRQLQVFVSRGSRATGGLVDVRAAEGRQVRLGGPR